MIDRKRTYIMFAIVTLASAIGNLAQTSVNAMLGGINASFGTDDSASQWLTTSYMLAIGITVPLVTHLSRRFSVRMLTLASLAFSLVGAIVAALAPTFVVLLSARILQAIGCGITLPIIQTLAMTRFPPGQNATAMGIAGIAMGFAPNIGPLVGGSLVDTLGWRSFFWMFCVAVVILIVCTLVFIRRREHEVQKVHLDLLSFVLSTLGFGGLLLSFSNASSMGIMEGWVLAPLAVGTVCLILFFMRQKHVEHPLISLEIFHSRTYDASLISQNLLFASFMGITLILPLFVINISGLGPVEAGLVFLPTTILAIVFNPLAGILADRIGARSVIIVSAGFLSIGAISMAFMTADTPLWLIMTMQALRGIGVSSLIGPFNSWGLSKLDFKWMVDGSAFFTMARQACASFGTALMMMVVALSGSTALGYQLAFGLSALFAVATLITSIITVGRTGD